jgi:hypothetical protein
MSGQLPNPSIRAGRHQQARASDNRRYGGARIDLRFTRREGALPKLPLELLPFFLKVPRKAAIADALEIWDETAATADGT